MKKIYTMMCTLIQNKQIKYVIMKTKYLTFNIKFSNSDFFGVMLESQDVSPFSPFNAVEISTQETCPFCGKKLTGLSCDCNGFKSMLKDLQQRFGDKEHECSLHYDELLGNPMPTVMGIENVSAIALSDEQKNSLGPDFWDCANQCFYDDDQGFLLVANDCYNENLHEVTFYCKDIVSKTVYQCKVGYEYVESKIYLGKYIIKLTPNLCDNSPSDCSFGNYKNIASFESLSKIYSMFGLD